MDTLRALRTTHVLAALLAIGTITADSACNPSRATDLFAPVRQGLRAVTQLIRVHAPEGPAAATITTGVRG